MAVRLFFKTGYQVQSLDVLCDYLDQARLHGPKVGTIASGCRASEHARDRRRYCLLSA
jgi:hypothetical protein